MVPDEDIEDINSKGVLLYLIYKGTCANNKLLYPRTATSTVS